MSCALQADKDVVVDLSRCHFADASLMIDLAVLARRLRPRGGCVHLRAAQPQIRTLIELTGLHRLEAVELEAAGLAHG